MGVATDTAVLNQRTIADRGRGAADVFPAAMAFATYGVVGKATMHAGFTLSAVLFLRFAIASCALFLLAVAMDERPSYSAMLSSSILGLLYGAASGAYLQIVHVAGAAYAALFLYAHPVVVIAFEAISGGGVTVARVALAATALLGTSLLVGGDAEPLSPLVVAVGLSSAVCYAAFLIVASRTISAREEIISASILTAVAATMFMPAGLFARPPSGAWPAAYGLIALLAIVGTALPICLLAWGARRIGAQRTSIIGTIEPIGAVALSVSIAGEHLTLLQMSGVALLIAASAAAVVKPKRRGTPPSALFATSQNSPEHEADTLRVLDAPVSVHSHYCSETKGIN